VYLLRTASCTNSSVLPIFDDTLRVFIRDVERSAFG